jgi:DNA-binding transcriptional regulator YiaG
VSKEKAAVVMRLRDEQHVMRKKQLLQAIATLTAQLEGAKKENLLLEAQMKAYVSKQDFAKMMDGQAKTKSCSSLAEAIQGGGEVLALRAALKLARHNFAAALRHSAETLRALPDLVLSEFCPSALLMREEGLDSLLKEDAQSVLYYWLHHHLASIGIKPSNFFEQAATITPLLLLLSRLAPDALPDKFVQKTVGLDDPTRKLRLFKTGWERCFRTRPHFDFDKLLTGDRNVVHTVIASLFLTHPHLRCYRTVPLRQKLAAFASALDTTAAFVHARAEAPPDELFSLSDLGFLKALFLAEETFSDEADALVAALRPPQPLDAMFEPLAKFVALPLRLVNAIAASEGQEGAARERLFKLMTEFHMQASSGYVHDVKRAAQEAVAEAEGRLRRAEGTIARLAAEVEKTREEHFEEARTKAMELFLARVNVTTLKDVFSKHPMIGVEQDVALMRGIGVLEWGGVTIYLAFVASSAHPPPPSISAPSSSAQSCSISFDASEGHPLYF